MELASGPAVQSRHHLRTVQTTVEGTPFAGIMNTALCDFWYAAPTLTYLLTYLHIKADIFGIKRAINKRKIRKTDTKLQVQLKGVCYISSKFCELCPHKELILSGGFWPAVTDRIFDDVMIPVRISSHQTHYVDKRKNYFTMKYVVTKRACKRFTQIL